MAAVRWEELLRGTASLSCETCHTERKILGFSWCNGNPNPNDDPGLRTVMSSDYRFWFAKPGEVRLVCGHPAEAEIVY
jgi:hypothetical protein